MQTQHLPDVTAVGEVNNKDIKWVRSQFSYQLKYLPVRLFSIIITQKWYGLVCMQFLGQMWSLLSNLDAVAKVSWTEGI